MTDPLRSRSRPALLSLLLALLLAVATAAQSTHVVNGPDLQRAIDAAAPGDILLVSGTYSAVDLRITKPLHIHGRTGAQISTLLTPTRIEGIPAGTTLTLQGFALLFREIEVRNCAGAVLLADVIVEQTTTSATLIDNCLQVAVDDCRFASGLVASTSTVLLTRSQLSGRNGVGRLNIPSGPGLRASNATVIAVATRFQGGFGDVTFPAQAGIYLGNGDLRLSGGGNVVIAGNGFTTPVDAIDGTGRAAYDPRTTFQPFGAGQPIDPQIAASLSHLPVTTINRTGLGDLAWVSVDGAAHDFFALLGVTPTARIALPGYSGELWVSLNVLALGSLDNAGRFTLGFVVPNVDVLRGFLFRWQGVTSDGVVVRFGEPITESHR